VTLQRCQELDIVASLRTIQGQLSVTGRRTAGLFMAPHQGASMGGNSPLQHHA
jgi:hypothetical protein